MNNSRKKITVFSVINGLVFIIISLIILVPLWKILVDSFDLRTAYGMKMWPEEFGLDGYKHIFSNVTLYRPLLISVLTTISGTILALILTTMGAYVLIQWDMPGRTLFANLLLFTMIFNGGMIPTYLVLNGLHLTDTLWVVILYPALNVYNLVLMRNFFEGIPSSLFEAATLDGCSPMQTFIRVVLPMSKAALASIGLMFAVSYWNDYTHYRLYIRNSDLYNFQMKLRGMIMGSELPTVSGNATENTLKNAAVIVVIVPFMILYPCLQKYFVKGVNVGAVKE
jgi:putative aldouronate transport system permease protein